MKVNFAAFANALCHRNATPLSAAVLVGETGKAKMEQCLGGGLLSLSFSLSLSRCSHFLASLWAKFKGLFYSFYRSFILSCHKIFLFHRGFLSYFCSFFSSFCSCFSFYRSFNSSFCLQKAFFGALCFFEIFKCFVFWAFCAHHRKPFL